MSNSVIAQERAIKRLRALGWGVSNHPDYTLDKVIRRFQAAHLEPDGTQLVADGVIGPKTERALYEVYDLPSVFTLSHRAMAVAISQAGVQEVPTSSNRGPQVDLYHASVAAPPGAPWCMSFMYWCHGQAARQLGVANPLPKTAHCKTSYLSAVENGLSHLEASEAVKNPDLVVPGMVPIWIIAPLTGAGHTGIITKTEGRSWNTIEGNSNENGSREGEIVARQSKRKVTDKILLGLLGPF